MSDFFFTQVCVQVAVLKIDRDFSTVLPQKAIRNSICHLLRDSGLEWTRFFNGFFLDYYGLPHVESHMDSTTFIVDIPNKVAAIPGTGNDLMTWTYTRDVASFVVAALDIPHWDEETYCYGDKMTWNEFVQLAEEMTGKWTKRNGRFWGCKTLLILA